MEKASNTPALPAALVRAIAAYGDKRAADAAVRALQGTDGLLRVVAGVRAAVGDAEGLLTDDELLHRLNALAAPAADVDAQARGLTAELLPKPRKLWGTAADVDNRPALYTESDALSFGEQMYRLGRQHGRQDNREARRAADAQKIHEDEAAWSDWRRGAGPKPGGAR